MDPQKPKLREKIIRYKGQNIIVYFHVDRCTHVAECLEGLPEVFNSLKTPWVMPDAASAEAVADVILRCPTGALHFKRLDGFPEEQVPFDNVLKLDDRGPLYAAGDVEVYNQEGELLLKDTRIAFCRCGESRHKPFCDSMHYLADFKDKGKMKKEKEAASLPEGQPLKVTLMKDGPMKCQGPMRIVGSNNKTGFSGEKALLCRCGRSENHPFCDGSHVKAGFKAE